MRALEEEDTPEEQFFRDVDQFALNQDDMEQKYAYSAKAIKRMEEMGLGVRKKPKFQDVHERIFEGIKAGQYFDGRLPVVLKKLSMDDLSVLYSLFSNWYGYLVEQLGKIAAERSEAKRQHEAAWSMIRMSHIKLAKKLKITLSDQKASDLARFDSRYVPYSAKFEELDVLYKMLQGVLRTASSDQDVISREVTIRQVQIDAEARGRGIASAPSRFGPDRAGLPPMQRRGVPDFDTEEEDSRDDESEDSTPRKVKTKFKRAAKPKPPTPGAALRIGRLGLDPRGAKKKG